jgi:hypothetical protein
MRRTTSLVGGILAVFLLLGCGGGGGGGSSESLYTGVTSPAVFTQDNVVDVATQAYQAGTTVSSASVMPLGDSGRDGYGGANPRAIAVVRILRGVAETVRYPASYPSHAMSANTATPMEVITESDTLYDGFGGSASYTMTVDTESGDFSGTFTFTNWHGDGGQEISGTTSVSGNIDTGTGEFTLMRFTFHAVTMVDGPESVTLTGSVDFSTVGNSPSATIEMYIQESGSGKTVWIHGYTMTITDGPDVNPQDGIPDFTDVVISGRIYLHDYGCVDVSTPTPFHFNSGSANPDVGVFRIEGSQGRSAQLVVIDELTGYYVEADLEPDGVYEWSSITYPWI